MTIGWKLIGKRGRRRGSNPRARERGDERRRDPGEHCPSLSLFALVGERSTVFGDH